MADGSFTAAGVTARITVVVVGMACFRNIFIFSRTADLTGVNLCATGGTGRFLGIRTGIPAVGDVPGSATAVTGSVAAVAVTVGAGYGNAHRTAGGLSICLKCYANIRFSKRRIIFHLQFKLKNIAGNFTAICVSKNTIATACAKICHKCAAQ